MTSLPEKIWRHLPGEFFCISTAVRIGNKNTQWKDKWFTKAEFHEIEKLVFEDLDREIYFCLHGFSHRRRLKENAVLPNMLWADLDEVDPHKLGELEPTYAWETSPGRYACAWLIRDGKYNEDIAQRLTYKLGADKGGWDLTQVLRVPGTLNHKYRGNPKVKLLWANEKQDFYFKDIKLLSGSHLQHSPVLADVWKKWERRVDPFVRRELFTPRHVVAGKRSEVLWKLTNLLIEAGVGDEECFTLLRESRWNKFDDRHNGDNQLKREIEKARGLKGFIQPEEETKPKERAYEIRKLSQVEDKDLEWLWPNFLTRGGITIFDGDPGIGKSYVGLMVCKAVVDGGSLPGIDKVDKGRVLYFDPENSVEYSTKRRALANGVINFDDINFVDKSFPLDSEVFLEQIRTDLEEISPSLVIFDPLTYFLGGSDSYKAPEVAALLSNMSEMARKYDCCMLMMRHLTKNSKTEALYRGQGSVAFSGVARIVMLGHRMKDDWVGIGQAKTNVSKPFHKVLPFKVDEQPGLKINGHPVLKDASILKWGKFKDMTVEELLAIDPRAPEPKGDVSILVSEFLMGILGEGPIDRTAIERAVREHEKRGKFTMKDVLKYREELGIDVKIIGAGQARREMWVLNET